MKSQEIKDRLIAANAPFFANDNISKYINPEDMDELSLEVEDRVKALLQSLVIDVENDHNTKDTAKRVAKMYLKEVFEGRYVECPKATDFPNAKQVDEIYAVGPITIRSACSHHLAPIMGKAWVGVIPGDRVIGLSKFNRIAHWVLSRPQIQEEAVVQLADELEAKMKPHALGVMIKASHFCGCWRGVKDDSEMTTSVMRGLFLSEHSARSELLQIFGGMGFNG